MDQAQLRKRIGDFSDDLEAMHIRLEEIVWNLDAEEEARKIKALEAQGFRIIDGGQVSETRWEVKDHQTGEILGEGSCEDGYESYDELLNRHDEWYHVDHIHDQIFEDAQAN